MVRVESVELSRPGRAELKLARAERVEVSWLIVGRRRESFALLPFGVFRLGVYSNPNARTVLMISHVIPMHVISRQVYFRPSRRFRADVGCRLKYGVINAGCHGTNEDT